MRTRSTVLLSAFVMFHGTIVQLNVLNDKSDSYWYDSTVGDEKKKEIIVDAMSSTFALNATIGSD